MRVQDRMARVRVEVRRKKSESLIRRGLNNGAGEYHASLNWMGDALDAPKNCRGSRGGKRCLDLYWKRGGFLAAGVGPGREKCNNLRRFLTVQAPIGDALLGGEGEGAEKRDGHKASSVNVKRMGPLRGRLHH